MNYVGYNCLDDLDECKGGKYVCDHNAICVNTVGSYQCNCRDGYYMGEDSICISTITFYYLFYILLLLKYYIALVWYYYIVLLWY